jgi:hypothetical protein
MVFSRQNHGNKGVSLQNCRFNQFSKQTFKGIPSPEQIQAAEHLPPISLFKTIQHLGQEAPSTLLAGEICRI